MASLRQVLSVFKPKTVKQVNNVLKQAGMPEVAQQVQKAYSNPNNVKPETPVQTLKEAEKKLVQNSKKLGVSPQEAKETVSQLNSFVKSLNPKNLPRSAKEALDVMDLVRDLNDVMDHPDDLKSYIYDLMGRKDVPESLKKRLQKEIIPKLDKVTGLQQLKQDLKYSVPDIDKYNTFHGIATAVTDRVNKLEGEIRQLKQKLEKAGSDQKVVQQLKAKIDRLENERQTLQSKLENLEREQERVQKLKQEISSELKKVSGSFDKANKDVEAQSKAYKAAADIEKAKSVYATLISVGSLILALAIMKYKGKTFNPINFFKSDVSLFLKVLVAILLAVAVVGLVHAVMSYIKYTSYKSKAQALAQVIRIYSKAVPLDQIKEIVKSL